MYIESEGLLKHFPNVHLLSESELQLIAENSNIASFRKKDIIFRQGTRTSHIMIVIKGLVKIVKEGKNGRSIILQLATPGNYIGLLSVLGTRIHQYSASTLEDTDICFIDISIFKNIILGNGKFGLQLLNLISREGLYIFERLINQTQKQLPGKIADVLLYFSKEVYHNNKFILPLTRRELAQFAGTTKESFIRTLTEFRNDKIIILNGSEVEIISLDIINTLSEFG